MSSKKKPAKKTARKPAAKAVKPAVTVTRPVPSSKAINQAAVANLDIALALPTAVAKKSRDKVTAALMAAGGVTEAELAEPIAVSRAKFFDNDDDRLHELTAPGVYREAGGSHTTILLYIGRNKAQHVPMDDGGLRVVSTLIKDFRGDWRAANYTAHDAAKKYLSVTHFDIAPRARAALEAVRDGADAAKVKAALDRPLPGEDAPATGMAAGLLAAGRTAQKKARSVNLPKAQGIGAWVCAQLTAKVDDAKILIEVAKKFPGAKTNAAHLNWYRNKMKRAGELA